MSDQTAAELEREAERARARVADTAETIKSKLSAGQLIDEFTTMFSGREGSGSLGVVKDQVRDNPMAVALIATGLAWLAFGGSRSDWVAEGMSEHDGSARSRRSMASAAGDAVSAAKDSMSQAGAALAGAFGSDRVAEGMSDHAGSARSGRSMASAAGDAAAAAKEGVSQAGAALADTFGRAASASGDYVENASGKSSDYLHRAGKSASELIDQEPLILAGLGLALGTAIGAMLPVTRFEQEEFGEQAERLRHQVKDAVQKGVEEAKDVAGKAYGAMTDEADRQGLAPDNAGTVVDRMGAVVRSAADATEEAIQEKLNRGEGDKSRS